MAGRNGFTFRIAVHSERLAEPTLRSCTAAILSNWRSRDDASCCELSVRIDVQAFAHTKELEKWSGRLDSNQRPPAPKAKEPTQLGAAGDRCPSFSLGNSRFGATA